MQITIGTDGGLAPSPVIGEPVLVIGVTAIDCAPPPITMGEPAVWGDLIHWRHRAGSNCAGYHVRDHCAHSDLPDANPSMCFLPLSEIACLRNDLFPSVCDIQGDSAERPLANSHARHES